MCVCVSACVCVCVCVCVQGLVCVKSIAAHRPGPMVIQADGHPSHHGVRGLRLCKQGQVLLSGES